MLSCIFVLDYERIITVEKLKKNKQTNNDHFSAPIALTLM